MRDEDPANSEVSDIIPADTPGMYRFKSHEEAHADMELIMRSREAREVASREKGRTP